ncbi:hypothetical protein D1816_01205 [Aquimarina sp. AD10]|uniref:Uncharacterized protein n=1 Tax=Aquimarina aggregata TaxID=1642818 RepID=A0A163BMC6_9FLAO|nr:MULTISPECIES: hypothetical protein [Aquimarina]AXT59024.1 hypothetical protein D1816_01205 [Aquimarina sp. AD10]KZS41543.1 hypothetical protein AWE51_21285 [Aquimarina aggregata]RKM95119.1 hypothetical protein D7033_17670 [Aquimarina sp. AD10]
MELSNIEKLLEKYFEGETTISEEKELKVYFTRETVPSHLERYRDLFQYFSEESTITATRDLKLKTRNRPKFAWVGMAASIALITGLFLTRTNPPPEKVDTFEDPEIALQETKKILSMVSQYMNEGKQGLVYLKEFENTKSKFIK